MYAFFKGELAGKGGNYAVVNCAGVGYKIFTGRGFLDQAKEGEEVTLYTHLVVREGELSLYGFPSMDEKGMFEKLINVSGVGPKVALSILSALSYTEVASAIFGADVSAFLKVPGVGRKTAERVVLELKDKVDASEALPKNALSQVRYSAANEAVEALQSLGYQKAEASQAVRAVCELADTAEDLILLALKRLDRR